MTRIPKKEEKEFKKFSEDASLRRDMEIISAQKVNPFFKNGSTDVDAYIEFVTQFNEFINHQPKPFRRIIDRDCRF